MANIQERAGSVLVRLGGNTQVRGNGRHAAGWAHDFEAEGSGTADGALRSFLINPNDALRLIFAAGRPRHQPWCIPSIFSTWQLISPHS